MKQSPLILSLSIFASAIALSLAIVAYAATSYFQHESPQAIRRVAAQQCLTLSQGKDISGSIEKNGWTVEKANLNTALFDECMKKMGQ